MYQPTLIIDQSSNLFNIDKIFIECACYSVSHELKWVLITDRQNEFTLEGLYKILMENLKISFIYYSMSETNFILIGCHYTKVNQISKIFKNNYVHSTDWISIIKYLSKANWSIRKIQNDILIWNIVDTWTLKSLLDYATNMAGDVPDNWTPLTETPEFEIKYKAYKLQCAKHYYVMYAWSIQNIGSTDFNIEFVYWFEKTFFITEE